MRHISNENFYRPKDSNFSDIKDKERFSAFLIVPVLAAIYFGAAKLGLSMAFEAEQVTIIWPPTGIALAAILLFGYRVWPGIALGAFLANITTNEPILTAGGIALGNTLEALSCVWMLNHFTEFNNSLSRLKDILSLVVFGSLGTMLAATVGVTSLCLGHVQPWSSFASLWQLWWLGDTTGALIFTPVLLVWGTWPHFSRGLRDITEAVILVIGLLITCWVIFANPHIVGVTGHAFIYLIFPFIIWAALRFGQRGTSLITLTASSIVIYTTLNGLGPFNVTQISTDQNMLTLVQLFMTVVAVTGLLLSASISEHKEAEKEKARLAAIVASSEDAIIGRGLDGTIYSWNSGAERLYGYSAKEAVGQHISIIVPPDRLEEENQILPKLYKGQHIEHYETTRMAKDGSLINISMTVSPIFDDNKNIIGISKIARNISARKKAERALNEANQRKDEFLATLAHELRNPLAPIRSALDIMKLANDPKINEEARCIIERQLQQMTRLVNDLLDVSRITRGKIDLRKEIVSLETIINNALETAKPLIEAQGHNISIMLPEHTILLKADTTRLSQVFANILNNAAKYTKPGGNIELTAESNDNEITVRIKDNGIGIPADKLSFIFDIFTQVDTSLERTQGGLGIGLTLVKKLIELHGGRIEAKSDGISKGSEFVVHLPVFNGGNKNKKLDNKTAENTPDPSHKLRILMVDDNEQYANTMGIILKMLGHEARLAYSGQEALEAIKAFIPDVVLLDIGLAGMDGYKVCRLMKENHELRKTIFVAQTGWGQEKHRRLSEESGFHHHLVKPIEIETLKNLLSSIKPHE